MARGTFFDFSIRNLDFCRINKQDDESSEDCIITIDVIFD